jgi:hypothetical protein
LISTHTPTEEKDEVAREEYYSSLVKVCDAGPNYDTKTVQGYHLDNKICSQIGHILGYRR